MENLVFTNKKTNKSIVFYPVAKNANSSAKQFFINHLNLSDRFYFIGDEIPGHIQKKLKMQNTKIFKHNKNKKNLVNFLPAYLPFKKL